MNGNIPSYRLDVTDLLDVLPTIADRAVDAVITDPPYAEIDRPYGRLTEDGPGLGPTDHLPRNPREG